MHDIGIVIVNYNVRNFLVQCLYSIRKSLLNGLDIEVWVVDNNSVDGSVAVIKKDFPEVNLIENKENLGFSKANNQAIRCLNSRYVLLLNPDTILEEDTLAKCYTFMEAHHDCGALGVRMIDGAGKFLPESKRKVPDLWNSFCKLSYLASLFPRSRIFGGYNLGYLPEFGTAEVEVLCGAFMFMRADLLAKTGLLDEDFFMYGEDIDLSYRILKEGYKIFYYPETTIIHYKGESTRKSTLNYVRTFYGAMVTYVNKHYAAGNARIFAFFIRIAIMIRALLSIISKVFSALWAPMLDFTFIALILYGLKTWWSQYYYHDLSYYPEHLMQFTIGVYALIWVTGLWFFGRYDSKPHQKHLSAGVVMSAFFVLVLYALAPESIRTSRALILLGTFAIFMYVHFTQFVGKYLNFSFSGSENRSISNIAIVAFRESAEKIIYILKKAEVHFDSVFVVSPEKNYTDPYYVNSVDHIKDLIRPLRITEVIFSNESMSAKEIIKAMSGLGSEVSIKIGGDDTLNIIGSNSRNYAGEFYSIEISYKLNNLMNRRFKRMVDIITSVILALIFPVLLFIVSRPGKLFAAIHSSFMGNNTWVGYGGDTQDFDFLPDLPDAIIPYPDTISAFHYTDDFFRKSNLDYAKNYSVWKDILLILKYALPFTVIFKDYSNE